MATVLVVDDEFGVGEILEAVLAEEGHQVFSAVNGRQALERLAEHKIDLVISDLMMPVLDGAGLLNAVRTNPVFDGVGFVLMSAVPELALDGGIKGYDAFLRKPFRLRSVLDMVARTLADRPRRSDGDGR